jgi:succinate-acetate transporter protein
MSSTHEMGTPRWSTTVADPAALGLAGFAMTTFVLSLANTGLIAGAGVAVLGLALFYGGLAQLAAGMWEFVKGNTFGAVAFSSYGAFWLSFWFLLTTGGAEKAGSAGVGAYLLAWTIFTAFMTIGAVKSSRVVLLVFIALTLTFLLLTIHAFSGVAAIGQIGGYLGIITAILAWYGAAASVINSTWKRTVLPVGAPS